MAIVLEARSVDEQRRKKVFLFGLIQIFGLVPHVMVVSDVLVTTSSTNLLIIAFP